ncbi:hypothetical protein [Ferruginibacter profundus]
MISIIGIGNYGLQNKNIMVVFLFGFHRILNRLTGVGFLSGPLFSGNHLKLFVLTQLILVAATGM